MSETELHPLIYNFLVTSKLKKTAKAFVKELKKTNDEFESALKLDKYKANLVSIYQSHKKATPAAKGKAKDDAGSDSSSSDSDDESSDSDDEEETKVTKKVAEPKKVEAAKKAESSSSSSDSDSDSDDEAKKEVTKKVEAPKKAESDSSSDSDSDSDDEDEKTKAKAKPVVSKKEDSSDSSSSSDSDSDDEDEKTKSEPAKVVEKKETAKKADSGSSSSDSSDSDSDSDDEMKVNNKRKREGDDGSSTPVAKKANTASSTEGCVVRVSGMPYETTEDNIKEFFKGMEIVGIDMPTWPDSGRSKGFANLTFGSKADAQKCIEMNGATMGTRWLKIESHNGRTPFKPGNPGEKPEGCTRVFVGNLSYDIDEEGLRNALKDCGEITRLKWGEDRDTGDFKGYAHVDFANSDDTEKAVALNGEMVLGRAMKVDYAQTNGSSPRASKGGGKVQPMTEKPEGCTTLFIANLSFEVNEDSLWEEFGKCGDVKAIRLATDRETGEYRGFGHVEFYDTKAADEAAKLLGKNICGRPIRMDWAKPRAK